MDSEIETIDKPNVSLLRESLAIMDEPLEPISFGKALVIVANLIALANEVLQAAEGTPKK